MQKLDNFFNVFNNLWKSIVENAFRKKLIIYFQF